MTFKFQDRKFNRINFLSFHEFLNTYYSFVFTPVLTYKWFVSTCCVKFTFSLGCLLLDTYYKCEQIQLSVQI